MKGPMNVLVRWQSKEKSSSVENDKISLRSRSLPPTAAVLTVDYECQRTNENWASRQYISPRFIAEIISS